MKQKHYIKKTAELTLIFFIILSSISSCKKEDPSTNTNTNNTKPNITIVSLEDTLSRNWEVIAATHNGANDPSSVGLKLNISNDGSYLLVTTGYKGTWEFIDQKTKVLLDKNTPSYKTTWTIVNMTSKTMNVTFKSPFTGGNATWALKAY